LNHAFLIWKYNISEPLDPGGAFTVSIWFDLIWLELFLEQEIVQFEFPPGTPSEKIIPIHMPCAIASIWSWLHFYLSLQPAAEYQGGGLLSKARTHAMCKRIYGFQIAGLARFACLAVSIHFLSFPLHSLHDNSWIFFPKKRDSIQEPFRLYTNIHFITLVNSLDEFNLLWCITLYIICLHARCCKIEFQ